MTSFGIVGAERAETVCLRLPERFGWIATELADLRRDDRLTQPEAGIKSGVGWKSISTFETGFRTDAISLAQLLALLDAYGVKASEFFARRGE